MARAEGKHRTGGCRHCPNRLDCRSADGSDDPADEPDILEDEDEPPLQAVPGGRPRDVRSALCEPHRRVADALAELFAAIAADPADEAEEPEAPLAERSTHRPPRPKDRLAA